MTTYMLNDRYYTASDGEGPTKKTSFIVFDRELVNAKIPTKSVYDWVIAKCPTQATADGVAQALNLCQKLEAGAGHISDLMNTKP